MKIIKTIAIVTALLSIVSWAYRFIDEHSRFEEILFYILVAAVIWLLLAVPLFSLRSENKVLRVISIILLIPFSALWVISILSRVLWPQDTLMLMSDIGQKRAFAINRRQV